MSWQDRPYAREETSSWGPRRPVYRGPGVEPLSVATTIIIANAIVYFLMFHSRYGQAIAGLGVMQAEAVWHGQVWRLFTATYLHANFTHILLNMLGLYFLGPALERVWGRRQFFLVYTLGGVAGNIILTLAGMVGFINPLTPGLGASGSVLTLMGAAVVLFPEAEVYVYFLFPVRLRDFVLVYGIGYVINVFQRGQNYGGDVCHLAGLGFGLLWAWSGGVSLSGRHRTVADPASLASRVRALVGRGLSGVGRRGGAARPRVSHPPIDGEAVDRILAKISQEGIQSLTNEERRILHEATASRRPPGGNQL